MVSPQAPIGSSFRGAIRTSETSKLSSKPLSQNLENCSEKPQSLS
uniref:PML-RAR alpha-regulated adaptor molecule 1 n=1 Tax=Mus musculus TaxID=10090 RepID=E9PYJ5_MOUSE